MRVNDTLEQLLTGQSLTEAQAEALMGAIMRGELTPAQIAGVLVALRAKGETVEEITGFARAMRAAAVPVRPQRQDVVDTCGTGGDGKGTFNISTTAAFVVAGAGLAVAKHGNRSISSRSGSADVLEALGIRLDLTPEQLARAIDEVGLAFLFAPRLHPAMKHAIGPRRELGIRTVFNILGPLTNPAGVPNLLLGVFSEALLQPMAEVLQRLGAHHVLVVHSRDGLDEIGIGDATEVAELKDGAVRRYAIAPEDFGLERAPIEAIRAEGPEQSLAIIREVLAGGSGPARDIVALNAGAAIYAADRADSLADGVSRAQAVLDSGAALERLEQLAELSRRLGGAA